jgi:VWFA-related protein
MTRLRLLAVVSLAMLALVPVRAQDAAVFRASVDAVTLSVSVRRGNRPVTGLEAGDFHLADNGVGQTLTALSYEKLPIDLTVLLDVSGSVTGAVLDQLRQAIGDLQRSLQAADRLRIVTFNMRIHRIFDGDAAAGPATAAFASLAGGGSSAVLDSIGVALAASAPQERRQLVVLLSDGKDSASILTPAMLIDIARRTSPTVSLVLATPLQRQPDPLYTELATETGGTVVSLRAGETLGDNLRSTLDQFRSSYVLSFVPAGVPRTGPHSLDVRVDRTGVEVRARRGYELR